MQDIADAAGVTRMTVSLALRRSAKISAPTRRRIQRISASLGYRVDPLIQRLTTYLGNVHRRQEGQVIAWINDWEERAAWRGYRAYAAMYDGAAARARERGYQLEEFWLREPGMTPAKLSRIVYQRGIECVIVGPLSRGGSEIKMDWAKFSAVAIGYSMRSPEINRVVNHQLHSAREAIRQLYARGYRRIGLSIPARDRVKPLVHAQTDAKVVLRWLEKERPDSILIQGAWLRETLTKAGYKVPRDLGIALLDWLDDAPNMAGINQRHEEAGSSAVDTVIAQVYSNERGIPAVPRTVMVEGCWVDGDSIRRKLKHY